MTNQYFSDIPQIQLAYEFIEFTGSHLFLTGKAGTGKTTFLRQFRERSSKQIVVTAPTGVAAINAGGVTLHSFFQLPFGPQILPVSSKQDAGNKQIDINKFNKEKIRIIRRMDVLIIDEISMVRADLLDAVDRVLRRYRKHNLPFGGVQVLMIGDICQLAPVVTDSDWQLLKGHYPTPFFFSSHVLSKIPYVTIELNHIFRQKDQKFIQLLNQVRENCLDSAGMKLLEKCYHPDYELADGCVILTTHNNQARQINDQQLNKLPGASTFFSAEVSGLFPEYAFPTELVLELKVGAQVMFARNDVSREKRFYNGRIGTIVALDAEAVVVQCTDGEVVETGMVEWHNYSYTIDAQTQEIKENLLGTFTQIPLKLAWAITIHKSQGLTFDRVVIDANAAFAAGQIYVALSRCKSLKGLILRSPIDSKRLFTDPDVKKFLSDASAEAPDSGVLQHAKTKYATDFMLDIFDFSYLTYRFDQFILLSTEQEKIFGAENISLLKKWFDIYKQDLVQIGIRFKKQLHQIIADKSVELEDNALLNERLKKSSDFFVQKLLLLKAQLMSEVVLVTKNKAVKKSLVDSLDRMDEVFNQKVNLLNELKFGLDIVRLNTVKNMDKPLIMAKALHSMVKYEKE